MDEQKQEIVLFTSNYCGHARSVKRFLTQHGIPVQVVNVDGNPEARARLIALNKGYASVPTLLFPDGSKLTEPSLSRLRQHFGIESESLRDRVRTLLDGD